MKKTLLIIMVSLSFSFAIACDYTVNLHDTFGDGWNGNTLTINVNGAPVLTDITVAVSDDVFNFSANPGDLITVVYTSDPGNFPDENEITINSDDLGTAVYTDGIGGTTPTGGSFTVGADCGLAPPANDEPCTAINLPMSAICNPTTGSVNGATPTAIPNPTCGTYTTNGDVWFETTVGASGLFQVDLTDGGIDANMAIYTGADCSNLNEVGCSISNTFYSDLIPAGTQVWIRIWDENNSIGGFTICPVEPLPPPTNNEPCTAEALTVNTTCINTTGTTESAINSAIADPTCSFNFQGGDVWYTATVPASGFMHVNLTAGGLQDGGIAVYSGADCNTLTEVACNETTWEMPPPVVITPANALQGQQVWIRIWEGDNDNPGSFEICLVDEPVLFVDPDTYTPEQLVEDILITGCLQASAVEYDGHTSAIAYFEGGANTFGMESGVVMGSGSMVALTGQGTDDTMGQETAQADVEADLSAISVLNSGSPEMHNEVILEFDFVPSSDTTEFDFVFASEEYPTYEHTDYNDVFAFFVSGPGINGSYADNAINVAIVPGTTDPITISSVNGPVADGGNGNNSAYFAAYTGGTTSVPNFAVGGYTVPITAVMAGLTPCETYHIKFCIADAGDESLSSYVFFEESSFSSGGDVAMNNVSNVGTQVDIYEGCENYYVFNRLDTSATALQDTVSIFVNVGGTATEGVDYTDIPDTMYILPGQMDFTLYYTAIFDNVDEVDEYIVFSLLNGCPCSMTSTNDTIWIKNNYNLNTTITDPQLICYGDSAELITTINPNIDSLLVTYTWDTGNTTNSIYPTPDITTDYSITITNICQDDVTLNTSITVVPTIDPSFTLSKDTACVGEPVTISFAGSTTSMAQFNWVFNEATPSSANGIGHHVVSWANIGDKTIDLAIDDQGCLSDTSIQIHIKEYNSMSLTTTNGDINCYSICDGTGSVQANTGISPFSYSWDNGQSQQTAVDLCPGLYRVTVTDFYGCKDTTHITVTTVNDLVYTFNTDSASCNGYSDGSAYLNVSGGIPPYSYQWSNETTEENNINVLAGTYAVTITDANGCQKIESNVIIGEPSAVIVSIYGDHYVNGDLWICIGEIETLRSSATGGSAPYIYKWNMGLTTSQIQVSPQTTTAYSAYAIDSRGCESPITNVVINVYDPISINTLVNPKDICRGELVNVNIVVEGGNGEYIYQLTSNSGTETVSDLFTIAPEESQNYIISVSDNCNSPIAESSFDINVHPIPEVSFHANVSSGCTPLEVDFIETSGNYDNSYLWEFIEINSDATISLDRHPSRIFNRPGQYHVKLTVKSDQNCISELTKYHYITAFPNPVAKFRAEPPVSSIIKPIIYFNNESTNADSYHWSFGDTDSSHQASPEHVFPNRVSEYLVELTAFNSYGCNNTFSDIIRIIDEITFYCPTAFSPNGDGKNDIFSIKGNGLIPEGFSMIIYDRWGEAIFKTSNINEGWNGKFSGGELVKPGIYPWVIRFKDANNISHEKAGYVNVIL